MNKGPCGLASSHDRACLLLVRSRGVGGVEGGFWFKVSVGDGIWGDGEGFPYRERWYDGLVRSVLTMGLEAIEWVDGLEGCDVFCASG